MGRRKKVEGFCRICGLYKKLSFEHVPPEAAFNNGKAYFLATVDELEQLDFVSLDSSMISKLPLDHFKKKQGGIGFNTLCDQCNNTTGSWYASDFIIWARQSMEILLKSNGRPTLHYPTHFFPLRVIKQIITMFFSIRVEGTCDDESELQTFILNKEKRHLSPKYRVYCYYNLNGSYRYLGDSFIGGIDGSSMIRTSELSFPPFGFVLTIDSEKPDNRLFEITHFANCDYNYWTDYYQNFPVLPTFLPHVPLDYRSKDEIIAAIKIGAKNKQER